MTYNNLSISFDNDLTKTIESFFNKININTLNLYFESNDYSYQLDLLEMNIPDNLNIYLWFIESIDVANKIINSQSNKFINLFGSNVSIWKISICKNIMFNCPFTLNDIIFFPLDFIIKQYHLNESIKIINTLIHEKIHIAQRKNEFIWEKFIELNNSEWKKIFSDKNEFKIINDFINKKKYNFIFNPDTTYDDFKYILIKYNIQYYGHYVYDFNTKKITKIFFIIDLNNKTLIPINSCLAKEEHPYEIYAYDISDALTKNL